MNITDAAKQAGVDPMDLPDICREVVWVATMGELERFAKIIRNQALEDAAKVCEEYEEGSGGHKAIRAMKEE